MGMLTVVGTMPTEGTLSMNNARRVVHAYSYSLTDIGGSDARQRIGTFINDLTQEQLTSDHETKTTILIHKHSFVVSVRSGQASIMKDGSLIKPQI